ncbi:MAG: Asp-tRNA(Asn)/Glu-tRNA(Gln) amidotransferase subunit GatB [Clostridia bacterium]|nr:Asp-tRNA(Asn)/Glu-tRNA(Gln) amidotransferase subunit GatB [Clostridia bacterium]MBQ4543533.1 Asp-tRNA(Asn)/Glu-tRNA(Gln) amidotransferase subunit GatB [Clostridia bacterium]
MNFETVIGLEVHAELKTKTKIYCGCPNEFGGETNTHCCPICTGMPGVLPVLNKTVVDYAIKAGLATNCEITKVGKQDRKNYFYPDLPKAYQTSQYDMPICKNGYIEIDVDGVKKKIGITRIHIEEDAGKLLHEASDGITLVDYNRCGVPLIEIVSEPDMRSADDAKAFLEALKAILEYTEVSDCKMQEGSLRCDVNVSVRPVGQKEFGTRTEMKNVNSFRAAYRAIQYEVKRQITEISAGNEIVQETRRWDDEKGITTSMRSKEEAHDYRYFPEPDLVSIVIDEDWVNKIKAEMPELPASRVARYIKEYNLSEYDAEQITLSKPLSDYFQKCVDVGATPKAVSNWILSDISKMLNEKNLTPDQIPFKAENLAKLIALIEKGTISNTAGKKVIEALFEQDQDPEEIVKKLGLVQISDEGELAKIVAEIIDANPQSVADYKAGKDKAVGFIVGQTMRATKGKGNPQIINKLILEELAKR